MKEYYILSVDLDPCIIADIRSLYTHIEHHLNRTRFYLDLDNPVHFAFHLKYSDLLHIVNDI